MRSPISCQWAVVCAAMIAVPSFALAQITAAPSPAPPLPSASPYESEPPVAIYDLSGPRLGATFAPDGDAVSQFGWHLEHQARSDKGGPAFIVETVLLVAGVDRNLFVPSGTLIFGMRLPNSFEFGLGPSLTLGGSQFSNTGLVLAMGQSFRFGGIRVPVNIAFAPGQDGDHRVTLITGWAIKDGVAYR